jgi:GNAT superfamily N-acetyltransferase
MKDLRHFIKTTIREFLNENIVNVTPREFFEEVSSFIKEYDNTKILNNLYSIFGVKTNNKGLLNKLYNELSYDEFIMLKNSVLNQKDDINQNTNVANNITLYYKDNRFLLYKKNEPIGFISYYYDNDADVYCVSGSYIVGKYQSKGYGTFLYETVMTNVYPKGCTMTRDSGTSPSAISVWERFDKRTDIKKERINFKGITHKREDLPSGFMSDDKEYIDKVLRLEDTRFFYNYGKDKLKSFLKQPLDDFDDILDDMVDRM